MDARTLLTALIGMAEPAPGGFVRILVTPAMIEQMRGVAGALPAAEEP